MRIQFMRSSLYNQWDFCQQSTALQYMFGFGSETGKKACMGTIVHKVLQILADQKLAIQNKLEEFTDEELGRFHVDRIDIDNLTSAAFNYYKSIEKHLVLVNLDLEACKSCVHKALKYSNGLVDPRNKEIVATEQFFDFEINQPWAKGLRMKGTVDLVVKSTDDLYEVIDYKGLPLETKIS